MKPEFRIDADYIIQKAVNTALKNIKPVYKSCLNCEHFDEGNEICKKYKQRPPARVIAYGCEGYEDLDIPF